MKKEMLILNNPDKIYSIIGQLPSKEYIDTLNLTAKEIENFCRESELDLSNTTKDDFVEKRCNPPLMIAHFYYYIYFNEKLPTQKEFKSFYYRLNSLWVRNKIGQRYRKGLDARLDRFYTSVMRELHYYHMVKDIENIKIEYTLELDVEHKVDLLIDDSYGVLLRVGTRDSLDYSLKKDDRLRWKHRQVYEHIDVPLDMRNCKQEKTKKDIFYFYSEQDVAVLKEKIKAK